MKAALIAGLVVFVAAQDAPAQDAKPDTRADFAAELEKLNVEYGAAMDEYYRPYEEAKTDEERRAITLDPEKNPSKKFRDRYRDLATRARGQAAGLSAIQWLLRDQAQTSRGSDCSPLIEEAVEHHLGLDEFARFVRGIGFYAQGVPAEKRKALLEKIRSQAKSPEVKAAALLVMASDAKGGRRGGGDAKAARALLERVIKEHPGTEAAKSAEGEIFEAEHLQVGMTPPDMEAVDQDGKKFKLSDYRGKVVVLDFWGYW
jgi:hypothetical protein